MTNDYRAMCAELVEAIEDDDFFRLKDALRFCEAVLSARTALAQPEPEGLTDEELLAMRSWPSHGPTFDSDLVDFARTVMVPVPQPVAVSERLPGAEDCDEQGQCWMSTTATDPSWVLDYPERCTNWTHWLPANALPITEAQ